MLKPYPRADDEDKRNNRRNVLCATSRIDITDYQQYFCPVNKNVATMQASRCPAQARFHVSFSPGGDVSSSGQKLLNILILVFHHLLIQATTTAEKHECSNVDFRYTSMGFLRT